jgi:limonene-1,2-epoxide hydrolase
VSSSQGEKGRVVAERDETLDVVRAYHRAWTSRNFDEAGRYLSDDLVTDVPLNTYADGAEFLAAVRGFGQLVAGVDLIAEVTDGAEAVLIYDIATEPVGTLRIAEHFTVADGRITQIRHVHDTAALRAAGFAGDDR